METITDRGERSRGARSNDMTHAQVNHCSAQPLALFAGGRQLPGKTHVKKGKMSLGLCKGTGTRSEIRGNCWRNRNRIYADRKQKEAAAEKKPLSLAV